MATTIFLVNPQTFPSSTSYLLDTYSAAAAYSLRQLKTGVTNVVRVRRSSDNAESDFTATEITDGTLATWATGTDGFVVTWYDQSGGGNDISNLIATEQAKLVSSGSVITKGSNPSLLFDGSNDYYNRGATLNTTSISIFSVVSSVSVSTIGTIHSQYSSGTNTIRTFCDSRTSPTRHMIISNGTTSYNFDLSTAYNDTNQRLLSSFIDASKNVSTFDNGNTGGSGSYTGTAQNDRLWLGKQSAGTFLSGYLQEFIAFNTDESANRTDIESDINTYYSIY